MRWCEVYQSKSCAADGMTKLVLLIDQINMLIQPYDISQHQLPDVISRPAPPPQSDADFMIFVKDVGSVGKIETTDLIRYRKCNEKPPFFSTASQGKYLLPDGSISTSTISNGTEVRLPIACVDDDDIDVFSLMLGDNGLPERDIDGNLLPKSTDIRNLSVRRVLDTIRGYVEIWANVHSTGSIGLPAVGENTPVGDRGRLF